MLIHIEINKYVQVDVIEKSNPYRVVVIHMEICSG